MSPVTMRGVLVWLASKACDTMKRSSSFLTAVLLHGAYTASMRRFAVIVGAGVALKARAKPLRVMGTIGVGVMNCLRSGLMRTHRPALLLRLYRVRRLGAEEKCTAYGASEACGWAREFLSGPCAWSGLCVLVSVRTTMSGS